MEHHPYRQAFAARDIDGVAALLADDVVFHSPVIADPGFEGRASVAALHAILFDTITDVEYTREVGDGKMHFLVANGRVRGKPIESTTTLEFDADQKIREIWVMVRPLTGVVAIAAAIGSQLAERRRAGLGAAVRALSKPLAGLASVTERGGSRLVTALNRSTSSLTVSRTGRPGGKSRMGRVFGRLMRQTSVFDRNGMRWMMQVLGPPPTVIVLVHRGRKSGRIYKTPLSMLAEDPERGEIVVSPMWGGDADWYQDVIAGGLVELHVRGEKRQVEWRELDEAERRAVGDTFRDAHPIYSRMILRTIARLNGFEGDPAEAAVRNLPMLGLRRGGAR
jgi:deazaflavin-dependent oxidoreductase (nitroreductase family)